MLFLQVLTKWLHHHISEMYVCVVLRAVCFALPVFLSPPAQLVELGFSQMLLGCCWAGLCWGFLELNLPELLIAAKHRACVQTACVQPISALFFTSNARLPETVDQTETVGFTCFLTWLSVQEMVFSHGLCRKLDVAAQKNQLAAPICTDNVTSDG